MNILAKRLTHPPITPKVTLYTRRKSRVTSLQKKKQNKTKQKNKKKGKGGASEERNKKWP